MSLFPHVKKECHDPTRSLSRLSDTVLAYMNSLIMVGEGN